MGGLRLALEVDCLVRALTYGRHEDLLRLRSSKAHRGPITSLDFKWPENNQRRGVTAPETATIILPSGRGPAVCPPPPEEGAPARPAEMYRVCGRIVQVTAGPQLRRTRICTSRSGPKKDGFGDNFDTEFIHKGEVNYGQALRGANEAESRRR